MVELGIPRFFSKEGKAWASNHGCSFNFVGGAFCSLGRESRSSPSVHPRSRRVVRRKKRFARDFLSTARATWWVLGGWVKEVLCFTVFHHVSPCFKAIQFSWVASSDCDNPQQPQKTSQNHGAFSRRTEVEKTDEIKTMFERPWKAVWTTNSP